MKPKPIVGLSEKFAENFWKHVRIGSPDECWPWLGGEKYGYGVVKTPDGARQAHRVAYTLRVGPIPEGLTLDHVKKRGCTTKLCCNDAHLEPVTQSVNIGRYNELRPRSPLCPNGHERPAGTRCGECVRIRREALPLSVKAEYRIRSIHRAAMMKAERNAAKLYALTCPKGHAKVFTDTHCRKCASLAVRASHRKYGYDWGAYKRARWERIRAEDPEGYAAKRLAFNRDKRAKRKARQRAA